MIRVPSKYSTSHYETLGIWLCKRAISLWHAAPNPFVKPFVSNRRFSFICGCGHSGTTLAASRLGSHSSALLLGRETNVFGPGYGNYCSRRIVDEWDYFAQAYSKDLIIEKTPLHIHSVTKIWRVLPNARIIVLTRNPLDNVASLYARFGHLEGAIRRWLSDNKAILSFRTHPKVRVVSYEALTLYPEKQLRELCEFLDLPWEPELLTARNTAYNIIEQHGNMAVRAQQIRDPIKPKVGSWKKILKENEAATIVKRTQKLACKLGYHDLR